MTDWMMYFSVGLAFFVIAVSPGPATISNATIAMSRGRKASLIYGAGLSFGLVFWGIVAASGMGAVLQSSVYVLMILKVLGGLYLFRLAWLSARAAKRGEMGEVHIDGHPRWFWQGFLLNLSNPKSVIAWMAALSVGLDANDSLPVIIAATSVCIIVGFVTNALYSLVFSVGGVMRVYQRCHHWVNGCVSVLFAIAGLSLIRSAFIRQS
ncbi:LysE family translocator [Vibrio quintilis]|uniref:Threonine efflux protein n=1 Tax=Vibrio quintilis TaxID=1117707 RepID=A0A1M7Z272_9VIBR|nr:LysE family translocator [Vibrio quintilis]SHO59067.1 Threonine efflux protein [Vibrio quintilis]